MAFKNSSRKSGLGGKGFGKSAGDAFASGMGSVGGFRHTPQPKISHFASNMSTSPRHLRNQYNSQVNTASNIVGNVTRSLLTNNRYSRNSSFGNAMGNALGGAIGSAIVMAVGNKIQQSQQEYADKKEAEALAAQQAAEAAEQAKREAAFHAMNKNMPNYDEKTAVHMMNGTGLTEEEKKRYPLKCPHCLGVPDGTRYCQYCGGKLV